jgi:hypothetical protein
MRFWNIFYRFNKSQENLVDGDPSRELSKSEVHTAGTDVTWRWSKTTFQYRNKSSTSVPTTEWIITEGLTFRPLRNVFLNLNGDYGKRKFKDTDETETDSRASADLQMRTSNRSRLTLEGFIQKTEGDVQDIKNTGFSALFQMLYRKLIGSVEYAYSEEEDGFVSQTIKNHNVIVEVKTKGW